MTRTLLGLLLTVVFSVAGVMPASAGDQSPAAEVVKLRERRAALNEKGNASEFTGKWRLKLPAGFEYDVKLEQCGDGLLTMSCPGHALNLLGDFACINGELRLVAAREERVGDYIWVYRNGKFVLGLDEQPFGATYRGASLTRLP